MLIVRAVVKIMSCPVLYNVRRCSLLIVLTYSSVIIREVQNNIENTTFASNQIVNDYICMQNKR